MIKDRQPHTFVYWHSRLNPKYNRLDRICTQRTKHYVADKREIHCLFLMRGDFPEAIVSVKDTRGDVAT